MTEPSPRDRSRVRRGPVPARRRRRARTPPPRRDAAARTAFADLDERPVAEHVGRLRGRARPAPARARHDRPALMARRSRLDAELVRRGLARSREHAVALIAEGRVAVAGQAATKPATGVEAGTPVVVRTDPDQPSWVSRGAHKLLGALDAFPVPVEGRRALDAGASTGGFTEVLLQPRRRRGRRRRRRLRRARLVAAHRRPGPGARAHQRPHPDARGDRRAGRPRRRRPVLHLAAAGAARADRLRARRTPTCCRWSSRSSRWAASGSAPGEWSATRSTGSQAVLEVAAGRGVARLGDRRGGGQPAARPGWQRGVLPVAAPRRRAAAGGRRPSSSRGGAAVSRAARRPATGRHAARRGAAARPAHRAHRPAGHRRARPHLGRPADRRRHRRPAARGRGRRRSSIADAEVVAADAEAARGAEIVMVFGGDGTFLRAAELARYTDAALMGVNLGRVGFLAETEPEAVEETLSAIERCQYSVEERLALAGRRPRRRRHRRRRHLGAQRGVGREGRALPGARRRPRHRRPAADQLRLRRRALRDPHRLHRLRVLRRRPGGLARRRGAAAGARATRTRCSPGPLVTSPNSVLTVAVPADGNRARVSADGRRIVEIPDGGRVDVRRADRPVRIARVHAVDLRRPAGRQVRPAGARLPRRPAPRRPGHELFTSRNVLARDIVTGDGRRR